MKKLLIALTLTACVTPLSYARSKFQTYIERGGTESIGSLAGTPLFVQRSCPGATVNVYLEGTTSLATIYRDVAGTSLSPVLTADAAGSIEFYGDEAAYDIRISGGGCSTHTRTIGPVTGIGASNNIAYIPVASALSSPATTIQAAITSFSQSGTAYCGGTIMLAGGVYSIATELQLSDGCPITIAGAGSDNDSIFLGTDSGTVLMATNESMRSVVALLGNSHVIKDVVVNADYKSTYGIYCAACARSKLVRVVVGAAEIDGIHYAASGNNNLTTLDHVVGDLNGTLYRTAGISADYTLYPNVVAATGTVATSAASTTLTFTGAADLTTLGIRSGDFIRVGGASAATAAYYQILSASTTTITLQTNSNNRPAATASGLEYAIGVGDGLHFAKHSDNNVADIIGGMYRLNAGSGIFMGGIFGNLYNGTLTDANAFFGIAESLADNSSATLDSVFIRPYFEGNLAGATWHVGVGAATMTNPSFNSDRPYRGDGVRPLTIERSGRREELRSGIDQDWAIQITNDGGTIKHRTVISHGLTAFLPIAVDGITGASATLTATPTVDSVTPFAAGAGLRSGALSNLIFNTPITIGSDVFKPSLMIEYNDTGSALRVYPTLISSNINGVTQARMVFVFTVEGTGAAFDLTTANIASGKIVTVRYSGKLPITARVSN